MHAFRANAIAIVIPRWEVNKWSKTGSARVRGTGDAYRSAEDRVFDRVQKPGFRAVEEVLFVIGYDSCVFLRGGPRGGLRNGVDLHFGDTVIGSRGDAGDFVLGGQLLDVATDRRHTGGQTCQQRRVLLTQ